MDCPSLQGDYRKLGAGMSFIPSADGKTSASNNSTATLNAGATYTGTAEDVSLYPSVTVAVKTDQAGTLYMQFSPDGTNWDSSLSFSVAAAVNEVHRLSVTRKYYRTVFTNTSGSNQTYFRLQTLFGRQAPLTSALNSTVQSDADSLVTRSVLMGQDDGGNFNFVPVDTHGHLEVALHSPLLPFGSVHTEKMHPVLQFDAVYGLVEDLEKTVVTGSGAVNHTNNMFQCSTGTTALSQAVLQSHRRLRYRPGQGAIMRFTALFSTPVASSIVVAGMGSAESGYFVGYNGTTFGFLHSTGGQREIRTLTITTASTATNNVQVVLDGTSYTVTGMTNSGSTLRTAYEISIGSDFNGWTAEAVGSTVVFTAGSAGSKTGSYSVAQSGAGTPVAGTFARTLAGVSATDTWYPQSSWDDPLDGTGPSGFTLDPSKGNIYQIDMQYLGFGSVTLSVETYAGDNNPVWTAVHTLRFPNTLTAPHITQPAFPFTAAAYSAGSTTDVWVKIGSAAGFIEGDKVLNGPRMSYGNTSTTVSTGAYYALMTIRNGYVYKNRPNQCVINILSFGGAHDDATPVTLYLLRDAILAGTPNFTQWSTSSATYVDTAATTATITDNGQIITSIPIGQGGQEILQFPDEILLDPGEQVTIAAKAVTGTATYVICTLNTREDQ